MRYNSIFLFVTLFLFSCESYLGEEDLSGFDFTSIKSITTTFISHQSDTDQKDNQIIAVATFYPDGTLERLTQHMTYPYDYKEPFDKEFWTEPLKGNLTHIMDGLNLGHAEKNILYGNDWPVSYAETIDRKGHPSFHSIREVLSDSKVDFIESSFPSIIEIGYGRGWELLENFEYSNNSVARYSFKYRREEEVRELMIQAMEEFRNELDENDTEGRRMADLRIKEMKEQKIAFNDVEFEYDNGQLAKVIEKENEYKFMYNNELLTRSEFHLRGQLMNHRIYYYNSDGIKEKTEIFNTNSDLEYTIEYNYEFF